MNKMTMKELPPELRPYERFELFGPSSLSDAELIAILLGSGRHGETVLDLSSRILTSQVQKGESGLVRLLNLHKEQLEQFDGIGRKKAITLLAAAEIARRYNTASHERPEIFSNPEDVAAHYYALMRGRDKEEVRAIWLDNRLQVKGETVLSIGSASHSVLSPREVFREALNVGALRFILIHNHPSGDPAPSGADLSITHQIAALGEMMELELVDHIIIGNDCYYSMNEHHQIDH